LYGGWAKEKNQTVPKMLFISTSF